MIKELFEKQPYYMEWLEELKNQYPIGEPFGLDYRDRLRYMHKRGYTELTLISSFIFAHTAAGSDVWMRRDMEWRNTIKEYQL